MILIADGGSTKCDWRVLDNSGKVLQTITTEGINPMYSESEDLIAALNQSELDKGFQSNINEIYFFGAGCAEGKGRDKMSKFLGSYFNQATKIYVRGDIVGAVYASSSDPCVVAILGTGSHACYFDGEAINFHVPSLGYQILDIGSGNMIGRTLLRHYYLNKLSSELMAKLEESYDVSVDVVKERLYNASESPSSYLASYARFVIENREYESMELILSSCIRQFYDDVLSQYDDVLKKVPLYFIGSVASYCQDIVLDVAIEKGYVVNGFHEKPIDGLVNNVWNLIDLT